MPCKNFMEMCQLCDKSDMLSVHRINTEQEGIS